MSTEATIARLKGQRSHPAGLDRCMLDRGSGMPPLLLCADDGTWGVELMEVMVVWTDPPPFVPGKVYEQVEVVSRLDHVHGQWDDDPKAKYVIVHPAMYQDFVAFCKRRNMGRAAN